MIVKKAQEILGINQQKAVVSIIGCGGKTTFMEVLAREFDHLKVLITTSTKIWIMKDDSVIQKLNLEEVRGHRAKKGVQCLGIANYETGKIHSLPESELARIIPKYDIVLIEADGSRGLPAKGWLENEPVIMPNTTHTVGIVTLGAIGKAADEDTVLSVAEFQEITGLKKGEIIDQNAVVEMICHKKGMFKNSVGKKALFINKIEDDTTITQAISLINHIKNKYNGYIDCFAYGSAIENKWTEV